MWFGEKYSLGSFFSVKKYLERSGNLNTNNFNFFNFLNFVIRILVIRQINWLIEDEIVSSSRLIIPVREKTLCNAVSHIKQFPGRPLCVATEVPLQFVFGPEQSIHHFIEVLSSFFIQTKMHIHSKRRYLLAFLQEPSSQLN